MYKCKRYLLTVIFFTVFLLSQSTVYADGEYASKLELINSDNIEFDVSLGQNQVKPIRLSIMNKGSEEWDIDHIFLSYHLMDEQGNILLNDGARTILTENVSPNRSIEITPAINIPIDKEWLNRNLFIQFDLMDEVGHWFSQSAEDNKLVLPVTFTKTNDFVIIDKEEKIYAFLKKNKIVDVQIKNTGTSTWDPKKGYSLAYHLLDKEHNVVIFDGVRSTLPEEIKPGEEVTISASVDLPNKNGLFYIEWSLVQDGVAWYDAEDSSSNLSSLHIYSSFWLYLIITIGALLLGTIIFLVRDYIRFRKIDYQRSLWDSVLFYVLRLDILWLLLSLIYKIKWSTLEITQSVTPNYYIYVYCGILLCGLALNCITHLKARLYVVLFLNLSVSFILLSDLVYFTYFHDVITTGTLLNVNQVAGVSDSVINLINVDHVYVLFSDILVFIPIYLIYRLKLIKTRTVHRKINVYAFIIGLIITSFCIGSNYYKLIKEDLFLKNYQNVLRVQNLGLINFHIYDTTNYFAQKFSRISPEDLEGIEEWKVNKEQTPKNEYSGVAKQKNVIMIQSEALQSFVINLKVRNMEVTPNLNAFIKDSIYFRNFYDQTNQGRTSDAEYISLNSLYPLSSGSVYTTYGNNTFDSLPKILSSMGYSTLSAHGYKGSFWNRIEIHPRMGFQKSYFQDNLVLYEQIGMGLSDGTMFIQSVEKIKELKEPYFSFLISLSNHHPYNIEVPAPMDLGDLEGTFIGQYVNSVHYADYAFGQLIDKLREEGMLDNTVIALYGDHNAGIELEEMNKVIPSAEDAMQREILYKGLPFVIHVPGLSGSVIDTSSGHVDITPTLLDLLGVEHNDNVFMGESIFSKDSPVIFRDGSYVTENYIVKDGVCYSADSLQECEDFSSEVNEQLTISDQIVRYNLVPKLLKDN